MKGKADLPEIWVEPLAVVVDVFENGADYLDILPDVLLIDTLK